MASYNRIILIGNLTRDPELRYLPSQTAVCDFGLAVNHRWRDRDGNQKEEVCFVDCSCFGKGGEIINQYMAKGRPLLVEGRLRLETWTGQDGQKRSRHSVLVENFQFLGEPRREEGAAKGPAAGRAAPQGGRDAAAPGHAGPTPSPSPPGDYDAPPAPRNEEIPF